MSSAGRHGGAEVEWNKYINHPYRLPDGLSLVEFWDVSLLITLYNSDFWTQLNSLKLTTWVSLACDYLPVMASSVLSKAAFSSAGITITKQHNHLKGDFVEALQILKSAY